MAFSTDLGPRAGFLGSLCGTVTKCGGMSLSPDDAYASPYKTSLPTPSETPSWHLYRKSYGCPLLLLPTGWYNTKLSTVELTNVRLKDHCAPDEGRFELIRYSECPTDGFQLGAADHYCMTLSKSDHLPGLRFPYLKKAELEAHQDPSLATYLLLWFV